MPECHSLRMIERSRCPKCETRAHNEAASTSANCARFVELCREMGLLATASVAIDGSKFKAVNNRDKNFTRAKVEWRRAQLEESGARHPGQLDPAGRQGAAGA